MLLFANTLVESRRLCVCTNTRLNPSTEVRVFTRGPYSTLEHGVNALTFGTSHNHAVHNLALNTKWGCYCSVSRPWERRWFVYTRICQGWTCAGILKCQSQMSFAWRCLSAQRAKEIQSRALNALCFNGATFEILHHPSIIQFLNIINREGGATSPMLQDRAADPLQSLRGILGCNLIGWLLGGFSHHRFLPTDLNAPR